MACSGRENPAGQGRSVIAMVEPMAMTEDTASAMVCSEEERGKGFLTRH